MKPRVYLFLIAALLLAWPAAAVTTNAPAAATFEVKGYRISGNTVLPPDKFAFLSSYTGPAVDLQTIREGLGRLQLLYRNLGYASVSVTLPQQRLTDGYIQVRVVEGRLSRITVTGNHYFSSNNVLSALPSLTTNEIINTRWFQRELDRANANRDRQIYPVISPGVQPGDTELNLVVVDRLPLHGHIELNNKGTPDTPPLRVDALLQYNNLWQLEHQVGVQYNFSPQQMKPEDTMPHFLEQPMVDSWSAFYRIPIGSQESLRDVYDRLPVDFGYNEVTHQFQLPPPTGRPEIVFYGSMASSDTYVTYSPRQNIFSNAIAEVSSQVAVRSLTYNNNAGTRLILPIREFLDVHSSFSAGFDYKFYEAYTYGTNLIYFDLYSLDPYGNRVLVTNQTVPLAANFHDQLWYAPLTFGWNASRKDPVGNTSFSVTPRVYFNGLASARTNFQIVALSPDAGGTYVTVNSGLVRDQQLPGNWSVLFRANGQWASEPLISNEQFGLGGTAGVRGYQEGETYGDSGWRTLCDLRAPPWLFAYFPNEPKDIPGFLRCSLFMDYGQAYRQNIVPPPVTRQWGTGMGFLMSITEHFDARLTVAWALLGTPATPAGTCRAYFSLGVQF